MQNPKGKFPKRRNPKGKSSNCQHLIELFQQAMIQMEEEEELLIVEHPRTTIKKPKRD